MAKNKNKKKNNNRGNDNSNSRPKVVTDLTQEQVDKIEKFSVEEMPERKSLLKNLLTPRKMTRGLMK